METSDLNTANILIVDDSAAQRLKLQKYLSNRDYTVVAVADGVAMKSVFETAVVDIVLLDVNMPGDDGFTLLPYLREHHEVGIIMVTSSDELVDRVLGLELGADDYITKPYEPRELIARIKSVLRRLNSTPTDKNFSNTKSMIQFGEHVLNLSTQQLFNKQGDSVELTSMEFDLLKAFADSPNRVLSREHLLSNAHDRDTDPYDRSIDIRIGRIRRKIEANPKKPTVIKTVRGSGYIFKCEK